MESKKHTSQSELKHNGILTDVLRRVSEKVKVEIKKKNQLNRDQQQTSNKK